MAPKYFTEYVLEKADDVVDVATELETELAEFDGPVEKFVDEAVAAYRDYLADLISRSSSRN